METAVILCAGYGKRLGKEIPKPLIKVAGREILYRTVILLKKTGVKNFILVVNPDNKEKIESFIRKLGVKYKIVLNTNPERENGYSLLLAKDFVKEETFILTMGDHIYSEEFIREALNGKGIVVDYKPLYTDEEEATKVFCKNGKVEDIGKGIKRFNCYDTGFFLLNKHIFSVAEKLIKEKESLTLSEIVKQAQTDCYPVVGKFWTDIDTVEDIKKAEKNLLKLSIKSVGDGFISRTLNRRISLWVSERLINRITPNQATFIVFLIWVLSAIVALYSPALGGILYQLSSTLDGIDGEIARASMRTSKFGGWLDSVLDRYVDFLFLSVLALHLEPLGAMLVWVLLAIFGSLMVSYTTERYRGAYREDAYEAVKELNYLPGKRDERIFFTALMCLLGWFELLFIVLALVTNLRSLFTLYFIWRRKGKE